LGRNSGNSSSVLLLEADVRKLNWDTVKALLTEAYQDWTEDEAPRMGAALAYYTVLSLAPLLLVTIAVAGFVLGQEAAQGQLMAQISDLLGNEGAKAVEGMIAGARHTDSGVVASILGTLALLWGASSVVGELQASLNKIWDVKQGDSGLSGTLKQKSYAVALVLGCGFLLLVSLAVSAGLSAVGKLLGNVLPVPEFVLHGLDLVTALVVFSLIFAAMFKFLPQAEISWRDVIPGAVFTATLFAIGKLAMGLYLGKASFGSTYGAAGSLVIVLVWVYYASQVFFFGAEVSHAYIASRHPKKDQSRATLTKASALAGVASGGAMLHSEAAQKDVASKAGAALGLGLVATKILRSLRGR